MKLILIFIFILNCCHWSIGEDKVTCWKGSCKEKNLKCYKDTAKCKKDAQKCRRIAFYDPSGKNIDHVEYGCGSADNQADAVKGLNGTKNMAKIFTCNTSDKCNEAAADGNWAGSETEKTTSATTKATSTTKPVTAGPEVEAGTDVEAANEGGAVSQSNSNMDGMIGSGAGQLLTALLVSLMTMAKSLLI